MIVYPRPMIDIGISECAFEQVRVDYLSPEAGGRLGAVSAGFPLWHMKLGLQNMASADGDAWIAWRDSLRGSQRRFLAYDVKRPVPRAYAAGGAFTATASSWAQSIDGQGNAVLTLQGMMAGMTLSIGDWIGFVWGDTKCSLVRVIEPGTASGAQTLVVSIEPAVPTVTPAGAVANLDHPTCLMRLVSEETALMSEVLGGYYPAGGQVGGVQDLIA